MRSLSKINNFGHLALHFIIHMISIPCGAEPHFKFCSSNTETYTLNSPYGKNLKNLLYSLSVNTSLKEGFYNTSFGTDNDQVYGQALCRGDVAADVCKSCVSNASKEIMKQCPGAQEAFLWYEKCQIQYSYSMSLNEAYTGKYPDSNNYEKNVSNPDSFHKDLKDLMNNLSNKTAYGHSKFMFATGKSNSVSKIETIYGLVQCTRDISQKSCKSCLDKAWGDIDGCCGHRQGGTLFSRSCNMRFEVYKFYEESSAKGKRWEMWEIFAVVCGAAIAIAGLIGCYVFHLCQRNEVQTDDDNSQRVLLHTMGATTRVTITEESNIFSSQDLPFMELAILKAATENFLDRRKLGQGGFGTVYKGVLPNGMEIAVKRLSRKSWQGIEEFKNEIILIAKLQHRNLVRLLSCGIEGNEKLLIYEYMPNKSLDRFIYDPEKRSQLGWDKRLNIITGIARGVLYLHEDSRLKIIHRDLKPSNVLLNHDMVAKISDFGMARIFGEDESTSNTKRVVGTYGYMAPEYAMGGQFSVKSDVFSFGVILLEIISGKRNSGFYLTEHAQTLVAYAWRLWNEGKELDFVDALLTETCPVAEVVRCIHIGLLCVQEDPEERPTMSSVVVLLGSESIALPQPGQPAFSVGRGAHKIDKSSSTDPSVNQNVLIGMDTPLFANRRVAAAEFSNSESDFSDGIPFIDDYFEAEDSEMFDIPTEWGMPDGFSWVHPIYFSKCLTKAVSMEYAKNMDHPSNGVSIVGWLRPTFIDEELYLRRLFNGEDSDDYNSDWEDDKLLGLNIKGDGNPTESTIYRLEIMRMELTSVYGVQSAISLREFREAKADILVHSTAAIVERFSEKGIRSKFALTALCKKKGLHVEGANLIGVDSLGIDVRVTAGIEVRTHRFPFKVRATSEAAAEKQIQQLLFPRSRRKKVGSHADGLGDLHPL